MNRLTIGDGFQFGCGFALASCLSWALLGIFWMLLMGLLTLLGLGGAIPVPQIPTIPSLPK